MPASGGTRDRHPCCRTGPGRSFGARPMPGAACRGAGNLEPQAFASVWRQSLAPRQQGVYRLLAACAVTRSWASPPSARARTLMPAPGTGELSALGVHPEARRVGHGSRLLNAAVDTLREPAPTGSTLGAGQRRGDPGVPARRAGWTLTARSATGWSPPTARPRARSGWSPTSPQSPGPVSPAGPVSGTALTPERRSQVVRQALSVARGDRHLRHQLRRAVGGRGPVDPADAGPVAAAVLGRFAVRLRGRPGSRGVRRAGRDRHLHASSASATVSTACRSRGCWTSAGCAGRVAAHLTIDESTAVGVAQPETAGARLGFWVTGLGVFVLWNATTLVGAVVGDAMGDPASTGSTPPPPPRSAPSCGRG